jgi:hypothetical protein
MFCSATVMVALLIDGPGRVCSFSICCNVRSSCGFDIDLIRHCNVSRLIHETIILTQCILYVLVSYAESRRTYFIDADLLRFVSFPNS